MRLQPSNKLLDVETMKNGLICQLVEENGSFSLEVYDSSFDGKNHHRGPLFTILPETIGQAIENESLMQQLGENILFRLAASNGIEL